METVIHSGCLLLLLFPLISAQIKKELEDAACLSEECTIAAGELLKNMDPLVNPCDDLYRFACGGFSDKLIYSDDQLVIDQFSIIEDSRNQKLHVFAESPIRNEDPEYLRNFKNLYQTCMDLERIEKIGLNPMRRWLKKLGSWPVTNTIWSPTMKWYELLMKIQELGLNSRILWNFDIVPDPKNTLTLTMQIDQPVLGLPKSFLDKGASDRVVKAYYDYMVGVAELLGASKPRSEIQMKEVLDFEMELAKHHDSNEKRKDAFHMYNKLTGREMLSRFPGIPWVQYVNWVLYPNHVVSMDETIIVSSPSYLSKLSEIISGTKERTVVNYILWRSVQNSVTFLNDKARNLRQVFLSKITGDAHEKPRWSQCISVAIKGLPQIAGSLYVKHYFKNSSKGEVATMIEYIRKQFEETLDGIHWMDKETRDKAKDKIRALKVYIGYPDEILDDNILKKLYAKLKLQSKDYYQNRISLNHFWWNFIVEKFRKKESSDPWIAHGNSAGVKATYTPSQNSIDIPAGILHESIFDSNSPKYLNYGTLGFIISSEIIKGFNEQGKQFDVSGNLMDWWNEDTSKRYALELKCFSNGDNSSAGSVPPSKSHEISVAIGAIKLAYDAYQRRNREMGREQPLPGLLKYTSSQMFWISFANMWCSSHNLSKLALANPTFGSQFGRIRFQPLAMNRQFAADFGCFLKPNSLQECSVW